MTNYKEILRLDSLGINKTKIAASCSCSRTTAISVLQKAKERGLKWETAAEMADKEVEKLLFPSEGEKSIYKKPDYEHVHREMAKSGVTLSLLWVEYCEECRKNGDIPYQSTQFYKYYGEHVQKTQATMHINRKPGEVMEVDWAGQTGEMIDTDTGEVIDVHIFVATLPYSGYSYVEAFMSQNQECWIAAHVNAYSHFGGTSRILVCDNLRTGVDRVTKGETVINKAYQEMARHYGTAVIPARVRAPKDKASVEGSVGIISTWIIAAIRNRQFLSLKELNEAIKEKLCEFNSKPFQKKEGSRALLFETEKLFLQPLPASPFELSAWKTATVPTGYHVSVEGQNYSVPFEYIGHRVDIRLTRNIVEIFYDSNRICSHKRLNGTMGQYSTNEAHMPPDHRKYIVWDGERFRVEAAKVGESATVVIQTLLDSASVEQQSYKACHSLLKLADRYSPESLEAACGKALSYTPRPTVKIVQAILKSLQNHPSDDEKEPQKPSGRGFTRGADYYRREK